ncbi:phosphate-starvation-inducible protein PsiE [Planococcus sp. N028]|uniref:Protein PsiE n=1 Tax=Planococcus shixiaomingii TaxID=3058393 RepID=A0ABT8MYS7_9BACL|nr:phosphate-starvation-inducible protein PsiE [Planococcus sp. N028]MDN7240774.1 phosphate-starvation-inducible protein PsiE [Planococcus sp. N028]
MKIKDKLGVVSIGIHHVLQMILNVSLVFLAVILSFQLLKELIVFSQFMVTNTDSNDYQSFFSRILVFFLYFEFIAMIVKYFKENYHFPLRYFMYIGITAMVRLIIVEHDNPLHTLYYSLVILILIIGYFIMNITPRERVASKWFFKNQATN